MNGLSFQALDCITGQHICDIWGENCYGEGLIARKVYSLLEKKLVRLKL